jgi:hypothetical protein
MIYSKLFLNLPKKSNSDDEVIDEYSRSFDRMRSYDFRIKTTFNFYLNFLMNLKLYLYIIKSYH